MSELLARPRGCWSLAERNSKAAELIAPQETTTISPQKVSTFPSRSTTTPRTSPPDASVCRRFTSEFVSNVTFGCFTASSMQTTWASDLAPTRQENPSHVPQRMQRLLCGFFSSSMTPTGTWNGFNPACAKSSDNCWIRGSWLTAGQGYGELAEGSVGSSPRLPCTWYRFSACV